jgi:hypothetical protein
LDDNGCADYDGRNDATAAEPEVWPRGDEPTADPGRWQMGEAFRQRMCRRCLPALALLATTVSVGCQVNIGGQTLPSPYYQSDDVQYFPAGPEFKLAREAAALEAIPPEPIGPGALKPGWTEPKWR